MVRVDFVYPLRMKGGFCEVSFARQLRNPDGIVRRVLGVWVLYFLTYFICCPFSLKTLNCRSPYWDQLIFMPRNGNSLFITI